MNTFDQLQQIIDENEKFRISFPNKQTSLIAFDKAVKRMRHIQDYLIKIDNSGLVFMSKPQMKKSIVKLFTALK